jgi:hypothetical protein
MCGRFASHPIDAIGLLKGFKRRAAILPSDRSVLIGRMAMKGSLTRACITSVLGQVDDHLAVEIIGTGATPDELIAAKAWLSNDEAMINAGHHLAAGRVGALVRIMARAEEDEAPAVTATDAADRAT